MKIFVFFAAVVALTSAQIENIQNGEYTVKYWFQYWINEIPSIISEIEAKPDQYFVQVDNEILGYLAPIYEYIVAPKEIKWPNFIKTSNGYQKATRTVGPFLNVWNSFEDLLSTILEPSVSDRKLDLEGIGSQIKDKLTEALKKSREALKEALGTFNSVTKP